MLEYICIYTYSVDPVLRLQLMVTSHLGAWAGVITHILGSRNLRLRRLLERILTWTPPPVDGGDIYISRIGT